MFTGRSTSDWLVKIDIADFQFLTSTKKALNSHQTIISISLWEGETMSSPCRVTKKLSEWKQMHVGPKKQPNKMWTTQHIHTIPTSCPILPTMFVFVSCVHRRVVEGSGEGIAVFWESSHTLPFTVALVIHTLEYFWKHTHFFSMFCVIPPDLGCCSLHLITVSYI